MVNFINNIMICNIIFFISFPTLLGISQFMRFFALPRGFSPLPCPADFYPCPTSRNKRPPRTSLLYMLKKENTAKRRYFELHYQSDQLINISLQSLQTAFYHSQHFPLRLHQVVIVPSIRASPLPPPSTKLPLTLANNS